MTEKRFVKGYHTIRDTKENKTHDFRVDIIVDLLNEQDKTIQELKSYLLHMGYKPVCHDDGHISLEQIEIKKMEIKNGLLDGWKND